MRREKLVGKTYHRFDLVEKALPKKAADSVTGKDPAQGVAKNREFCYSGGFGKIIVFFKNLIIRIEEIEPILEVSPPLSLYRAARESGRLLPLPGGHHTRQFHRLCLREYGCQQLVEQSPRRERANSTSFVNQIPTSKRGFVFPRIKLWHQHRKPRTNWVSSRDLHIEASKHNTYQVYLVRVLVPQLLRYEFEMGSVSPEPMRQDDQVDGFLISHDVTNWQRRDAGIEEGFIPNTERYRNSGTIFNRSERVVTSWAYAGLLIVPRPRVTFA